MSSEIASPVPITSRVPKGQRGRDRVAGLLAAAALFVERGVAATTMTEIAARAGASIGSLYLFFPTKQALAQAMLAGLADELSGRLDGLRLRVGGLGAAAIADAVFETLAGFLEEHPEYGVLVDQADDEAWRQGVRARRRGQIAGLFGLAKPALPLGQAERLALLLPAMMRAAMTLGAEAGSGHGGLLRELRAMLRHHLERA